jgi:hypothetical protein
MTPRTVAALSLVVAALMGCGDSATPGPVASPSAPDMAFPKPFVEAGAWQDTEFVFQPGPSRWPSLDAVLVQVRTYFLAGIHSQAADAGVTIVQTGVDPQTQTVTLLVTAIGGANDAVAGRQMRVLLHRDERGWWIDPKGAGRVYCLRPLAGFAGASCLD